ncbi:MAG: hypothetical protein ACREJC_11780, partial [Tepidisphaeraceae bacterium]
MNLLRPALCAALVAITVGYLSGSVASAAQFALFVAGVLMPLVALLGRALRGAVGRSDLRVCIGATLAIISVTPLYYLRRSLPFPEAAVDAALVLVLTGSALASGAYRAFFRAAACETLRFITPIVFVALPVVFCFAWMGFAVPDGSVVRYYGLYPV